MTCTREQLFDFEGCELRVVVVDGHPWWVAADLARALAVGRTHGVWTLTRRGRFASVPPVDRRIWPP